MVACPKKINSTPPTTHQHIQRHCRRKSFNAIIHAVFNVFSIVLQLVNGYAFTVVCMPITLELQYTISKCNGTMEQMNEWTKFLPEHLKYCTTQCQSSIFHAFYNFNKLFHMVKEQLEQICKQLINNAILMLTGIIQLQ